MRRKNSKEKHTGKGARGLILLLVFTFISFNLSLADNQPIPVSSEPIPEKPVDQSTVPDSSAPSSSTSTAFLDQSPLSFDSLQKNAESQPNALPDQQENDTGVEHNMGASELKEGCDRENSKTVAFEMDIGGLIYKGTKTTVRKGTFGTDRLVTITADAAVCEDDPDATCSGKLQRTTYFGANYSDSGSRTEKVEGERSTIGLEENGGSTSTNFKYDKTFIYQKGGRDQVAGDLIIDKLEEHDVNVYPDLTQTTIRDTTTATYYDYRGLETKYDQTIVESSHASDGVKLYDWSQERHENYVYDEDGDLLTLDKSTPKDIRFDYDAWGNVIKKSDFTSSTHLENKYVKTTDCMGIVKKLDSRKQIRKLRSTETDYTQQPPVVDTLDSFSANMENSVTGASSFSRKTKYTNNKPTSISISSVPRPGVNINILFKNGYYFSHTPNPPENIGPLYYESKDVGVSLGDNEGAYPVLFPVV